MTSFRVRPKFRITCDCPPKLLVDRINNNLEGNQDIIEGKVFVTHGLFRIVPGHQHFWSPQLSVSFEESEGKTIVRGMYGPHPTVWAVFLFGYAILGLALFWTLLVGLVKMSLHQESQILWATPFILGGFVTIWFIAQFGQKVGVEQTFQIHHFFEDVIGQSIHIG
ncbi:MAG: hypothetical protein IPO04_15805 [Cytophagaceae bacterium]|nr:hypothetical protein [Cytophagaceae bacterium]MBL0301144.1 hypothetical protein [Cytophagaceae bacterium]